MKLLTDESLHINSFSWDMEDSDTDMEDANEEINIIGSDEKDGKNLYFFYSWFI